MYDGGGRTWTGTLDDDDLDAFHIAYCLSP